MATAWLIEWEEAGRIRYVPMEYGVQAFDANLAQRWHSQGAAEKHLQTLRRWNAGYYTARVAEHEWPEPITKGGL